jgi:hypothetical protein
MKTCLPILITLCLTLQFSLIAQNMPDVNLHFDFDLVNCPSSPAIETTFYLSSADNTPWDVGFIMLTLTVDEVVLGTPPQMINPPAGWNTDIYRDGTQWQIELVNPTGGSVTAGNTPVEYFSLRWSYIMEGAVFSIQINDVDLGVNNSLEDEQMHYPDGLLITGSDDCASQTAEIDFYWSNPILTNCPQNPTLITPIEFASHNPGEVWQNGFIQLVIQQDNSILGQPQITNALPGWSTDVYAQGNEWVVELVASIDEPITDAGVHFFDLHWEYLQEGMPFAVTLNDIDLGLNVPNEMIFRPNGNVISGNKNCPCDVRINNVSVTCTNPCQGLATVFFDMEINNGPGGNFVYHINSVQKSIVLAAGDVLVLDENLTNVSLQNQPVYLVGFFSGTNCVDSILLPQINCGPCDIQIDAAAPTSCDATNNQYQLIVNISSQALCSGQVLVSIDNNPPSTMTLANGQIQISNLISDGVAHTVTVKDDQIGSACTASASFVAPSPCQVSSTIDMVQHLFDVSISPNPLFSGQQLNISAESNISNIQIFDFSGKRCLHQIAHGNSIQLDLNLLTKGIYMIVVSAQDGQSVNKLIVQ